MTEDSRTVRVAKRAYFAKKGKPLEDSSELWQKKWIELTRLILAANADVIAQDNDISHTVIEE